MTECRILGSYIQRRRINGISTANLNRTFGVTLHASQNIDMTHRKIHRVLAEGLSQKTH
ncbi:hypothetical protein D3C85_1869890 [compost metagenome]